MFFAAQQWLRSVNGSGLRSGEDHIVLFAVRRLQQRERALVILSAVTLYVSVPAERHKAMR